MKEPRPNKWAKVGKVSVILLTILFCLFGFAYLLTDVSTAAGKYQKNRDAVKQLGYPMSAEDIDRARAVRDDENAAVILMPALTRINPIWKKYDSKIKFEVYVKSTWPMIASDFPILEKASQMPTLVFKRDYRNPNDLEMPEINNIRYWIRFLIAKAGIEADQGDRELAVRYLSVATRLGALMEQDQEFLSISVRQYSASATLNLLRKWIRTHGKDPLWRASMNAVLEIIDRPYDMRPAVRTMYWKSRYLAEVILGQREDLRTPEEINGFDDVYPNMNSMKSQSRLFKLVPRYATASLSRIDEYYADLMKGYPSDLNDLKTIDDLAKKLDDQMDMTPKGIQYGLSLIIPNYVVPMFSIQISQSIHQEKVKTNLIREVMEMLDRHLDPAKGLPILGKDSIDLDGKPLRVVKDASGWKLYSVSRDLKDDGGDDTVEYPKDFVVRLPK